MIGAVIWLVHERLRLLREIQRTQARCEVLSAKCERVLAVCRHAGISCDMADLDERLRSMLAEIG